MKNCVCLLTYMAVSLTLLSCGDEWDSELPSRYLSLIAPENVHRELYVQCEMASGDNTFELNMHCQEYPGNFMIQSTKADGLRAYQDEKNIFIKSYLEEVWSRGYVPVAIQPVVDAGICGNARIFADEELFGIPAGEALNECFCLSMPADMNCILFTYPDYQVIHSGLECAQTIPFNEAFSDGMALCMSYRIQCVVQPKEHYENLALTIEIPIKSEYWLPKFAGEEYPDHFYADGRVERNENRVLKGTVSICLD